MAKEIQEITDKNLLNLVETKKENYSIVNAVNLVSLRELLWET